MSSQYIAYAKAVREEIFQHISQPLWHLKNLKDVSKVVVILSSPRSGSSLLFHLLSQTEQLLSLNGEHTSYYKLNRYSFPFHNFQSDCLGITDITIEDFNSFSRDFLSDVCVGGERVITTAEELQEFIQILALRLTLQWPNLALSAEQCFWHITAAYQQYFQHFSIWNSSRFLMKLWESLSMFYPSFNPFYYDIDPSVLKSQFPNINCPKAPPNPHFCIEEPPFVVIKPRRRPISEEISSKPWLLKASIDGFRFPLLKQLFPHADLKIIHLTRFPATSINGLYDGWHHRGFFSHNLEDVASLDIAGYSDVFDWGKHWWSYELPPQWKKVINQPLEYVCGLQWSSPHQAILETLKQEKPTNILKVRFEEILSSSQQRLQTIGRILEFIGIEEDDALKKEFEKMQPVMCSVPADETRWLNRKSLILPVINQESIRDLTNELGYKHMETALLTSCA